MKKGDLIFARRSITLEGAGQCCLVGDLDLETTFESSIIRVSLQEKRIYPTFIFLFFKGNIGRLQISRIVRQVAVSGITGSDLVNVRILIPPLPEQQKIAQILSTWDKAIVHEQDLIHQLQIRKKGLMQQLLSGKKRLDGFSGEWEKVKLGDIITRITKKNTELNDNVITISAQRGFVKQEDFFNKRVASKTLSGYYLIERGHFAYNKSYSKGYPMGAFKRLDNLDKAVVTTLYICFSIHEKVNSDYILNYFEGGFMVHNLMKIAQEGGRAHGLLNIGLNDFFSLKLVLPSKKEQTAIAQVLNQADEEIKNHQEHLLAFQEQKKGLMQQLLTGGIRVNPSC